ncbi:hypothetical protein [Azospirillum sp. sgz302134]
MADVIVFRHDKLPTLDQSFLDNVDIIDCTGRQKDPKPGEAIVGYGFPHKHETWPYATPDCAMGTFERKNGLMYEANLDVLEGHSGGPVFTDSGKFVGMMIGTTGPYARIVPAAFIRNLAMA